MKSVLVFFIVLGFATAAQAGAPKVGETVWAQWKPNAFYHGKVDKTCDWGLHVQFDDGDQGCFRADLVAVDAPMPAAAVKPGARVLAKWSDGKLYPATVTGKPDGGNVEVFFDDRTPYKASVKDLLAL
ncbi:MAG: hypothetical protein ABIK09_04245 [Pseudomonadota bacterium]